MELLEEAVQNATKRPGAAPTALHPSPPGSQEPIYQGSPTSRCVLSSPAPSTIPIQPGSFLVLLSLSTLGQTASTVWEIPLGSSPGL